MGLHARWRNGAKAANNQVNARCKSAIGIELASGPGGRAVLTSTRQLRGHVGGAAEGSNQDNIRLAWRRGGARAVAQSAAGCRLKRHL